LASFDKIFFIFKRDIMRVKICGLTNLIDANAAVRNGADALGFVIGGKILPVEIEPRAQHVRQWITTFPKYIDTYIVSFYTEVKDLIDLSEYVNSTGIQVSENVNHEQLKELRNKTNKKIIKTILVGENAFIDMKLAEPYCDFIRLNRNEQTNDWNLCAELIRSAKKPAFIAGGLTLTNLEQAINVTSPQGVDVSTGVSTYSETYLLKDRKDPHLMDKFIIMAKSKAPKCSCHAKPDAQYALFAHSCH
jgi:phosphoribosylanthranilate isomerase